ncbi:MAG: transporter substrate-binding domain-containing protein [Clostridiales bacterium]|nr:transporter substrate-binding domain-containing protein [Clostridiales bacterium]
MKAKKNLTLILITLAMFCTFILSGCSSASASAGSSAQVGNGVQAGNGTQVGNGAGTTASETEAEEADLLSRIQESGEIVVAMEGTWAPWTYHDEKDELVGYDVEVAQLIAEKLGVEVKFIEGEWDGLLAGLDDSRYDIMVNGVGITEERQEKYDFSTPYAYNRTAVIVRDDYDEINSMEDLNGKKTANTISSTYAMQAERYGAEVSGVDDLNQTIELLLSGRIDATLNAEVTFFDYVNAHPEAGIQIAAYSDEVERVAIPVRKGDDSASLLAAINDALAELSASGQLSGLSEKYFGTDISQES